MTVLGTSSNHDFQPPSAKLVGMVGMLGTNKLDGGKHTRRPSLSGDFQPRFQAPTREVSR